MCETSKATAQLLLGILLACNSIYHVHCTHLPCFAPSECTADSCLMCFAADTDCNFDNVTNTLSCQPNISQCSLQECEECQFCAASVVRTGQAWTLTSQCVNVNSLTCEQGDVTAQCIVSDSVTESALMANLEGDELFFPLSCQCTEPNCTQEFVLEYSIFPEQPIPSPSETPVETPTVNGDSSGKFPAGYSALIGVLSGLVIIGVIAIIVLWLVRRRKLSWQSISHGDIRNSVVSSQSTTDTSNSAAILNKNKIMAHDTDNKNSSNTVMVHGSLETDREGTIETGMLHMYTEPDNERRVGGPE